MSNGSPPIYEFGPFRLDPQERLLSREGQAVALTPKAFDTLLALVENRGHALEKGVLMKRLWPDAVVEEATLAQNVSTLRKILGDPASGGKYIETLPKRGYRFIANVRELTPGAPEAALGSDGLTELSDGEQPDRAAVNAWAPASTSTRSRSRTRWPLIAISLLALALLGLAGYVLWSRRAAISPTPRQPRRLAILPFRNLRPNQNTDFLGTSLPETIISRLGYVKTLVVRPSSYVEGYRDRAVDPRQAATELNVDTLLTGTYLVDGDDLRINPQLIAVDTSEVLWAEPIDVKYSKLITVQDTVAEKVIAGLRLKLTPDEVARLKSNSTQNALAYEYYLHGLDGYLANDFPLAIKMLQQAVNLDEGYAQGWAQLGTAYNAAATFDLRGQEYYSKAKAAYERAITLDPNQIEAQTFLANTYTDTGEVEKAVPLLRQVLKVNSNNALTHWELGYAYRFGGAVKESIEECELARRLDSRVKITSSAFNSYLYDGQFDKFLSSLPNQPDSTFVMFYRGLAHLYLKQEPTAAQEFDKAYDLKPAMLYARMGKALSYHIAGRNTEGIELMRESEHLIESRGVRDAESLYKISLAYAQLGDKSSALRLLRRSVEGGFFCYPYQSTDILMESLRGEPEFKKIMEISRQRHEGFIGRFF